MHAADGLSLCHRRGAGVDGGLRSAVFPPLLPPSSSSGMSSFWTKAPSARTWAWAVALVILTLTSVVVSLAMDGTFLADDQPAPESSTDPPPPPQPLRLTPLLEAGNATGARALAGVPALLPSCCDSYSGFLTVDKKHDSNLLFWFFPSETRRSTAPLVVWLQGGPGTSMLRAVFLENGPYQIEPKSKTLQRRRGSWTRSHSVLYFDNPVGTGYSFTGSSAGLSKNIGEISRNLVEALRQFFVVFPEQRGRDLYIAGESFGGKMATGLAHTIHRLPAIDPPAVAAFNLKGVLVVNGLIEAESQLDKSALAYQLGFVDEEGRDEMKAIADEQIRLMREDRWSEARKLSRDECGGAMSPQDTGMEGLTNLLLWNGTQDNGFQDLAQHQHIREALHVGNATFSGRAAAVARAISNDISKSVLAELAELADNYRVLVASGQMDMCLPYRLTANYLRKMRWRGAEDMARSPRVTWCVRGQLAGYARTTPSPKGVLTHVLVRNAGHYLGQDQPRWAADMLDRFTHGISFDTCEERCPTAKIRP